MFCASCGKHIPDGARFCPACGAVASTPDAVDHADVRADARQSSKGLGGWPLVFTISLFAVGAALAFSAVGGLAASALFRDTLDSLLGAQAVDVIAWTCAYSLTAALSCFIIAIALCRRSVQSLRLLQLLGIMLIVFAAVLLVLLNVSLMQQGANVIGRSILSLAGEIAVLLVTTLFFCRSQRMRSYLGGGAFLEKALFRI